MKIDGLFTIRSCWKFAAVCQFLNFYRGKLKLAYKLDLIEFEKGFVNESEHFLFADVHVKLLRLATNSEEISYTDRIRDLFWKNVIIALVLKYLSIKSSNCIDKKYIAAEELEFIHILEKNSYGDLNGLQKVALLYHMCSLASETELFREFADELIGFDLLRGVIIGEDRFKRKYWYLGDLRLYRETLPVKAIKRKVSGKNLQVRRRLILLL
jgi:hypothetical protein